MTLWNRQKSVDGKLIPVIVRGRGWEEGQHKKSLGVMDKEVKVKMRVMVLDGTMVMLYICEKHRMVHHKAWMLLYVNFKTQPQFQGNPRWDAEYDKWN